MPTPQVITRKVYKPALTVGQLYARAYGSTGLMLPLGNVLNLELAHAEDVQKQPDLTRLGGGTYAEVRRVSDVTISAALADLNVVNLARATLSTVAETDAGTAADQPITLYRGGLIPLPHVLLSSVVITKDTAPGTPLAAAGNYEVRPEGIWVYDNAPGVTDGDAAKLSYSFAGQAVLEALTTKAAELQLRFGGLNEADEGKPVVVDIWRASQGVTKSLGLLTGKFGQLDVTGTLMADQTKIGAGISRFYRTTMV
ncbi:hypothetical protein HNP55_003574 [Paucibacter oligotrophus]|uniref:Uncharacterized protein n=1 Tax=Roseateles oligotrophus TaxID=1769250 RepID=A0A840LFN7_9BURK|nr:hypothetical protein [Roseateles oligotrophus]MBB4845028.1 hypothetical protein [Roseateles oligotrophus]